MNDAARVVQKAHRANSGRIAPAPIEAHVVEARVVEARVVAVAPGPEPPSHRGGGAPIHREVLRDDSARKLQGLQRQRIARAKAQEARVLRVQRAARAQIEDRKVVVAPPCDKKLFVLEPEHRTYEEHERRAKARGMVLATIASPEENRPGREALALGGRSRVGLRELGARRSLSRNEPRAHRRRRELARREGRRELPEEATGPLPHRDGGPSVDGRARHGARIGLERRVLRCGVGGVLLRLTFEVSAREDAATLEIGRAHV